MEYTDKIYHEIAKQIINTIFWEKYEITIYKHKPWYENLSTFIVKEWNLLQDNDNIDSKYTELQEEMIVYEAFHILLDKMKIDGDEFEEFEQEVNWGRFDDIIGRYICML